MNYVGSPMYGVLDEHLGALLGIATGLVAIWFMRRRDSFALFRTLEPLEKVAVGIIAVDGFAHLGLALGHGGGLGLAFLLFGAALLWLARRALGGRPIRLRAALLMTGSILAFAIAGFAGSAPDQVGIIIKLAEIAVLAIVLRPEKGTRVRKLAESSAVISAAVLVAAGSWTGAFRDAGDGHHAGSAPPPGTLLPISEEREPTAEERAAAEALHAAVAESISGFADVALAAEAGYAVEGMADNGWHADNEAFKKDGRIFDPHAVETLVYAGGPEGPVLLGAMFQMDGIGEPGPEIGGLLTVWHAHERICLNLLPLSLGGLTGPFGSCPIGTVTIPITNEMIHVWTVPGAPDAFGHLDDEWIEAYVHGG